MEHRLLLTHLSFNIEWDQVLYSMVRHTVLALNSSLKITAVLIPEIVKGKLTTCYKARVQATDLHENDSDRTT